MPNQTIDLVCFDLGCVLIEICTDVSEACEIVGIDVPRDRLAHLRQQMGELLVLHETGRIDNETWTRQMAELTGLAPADATALLTAWLKRPFPGVCELIDDLRQHDRLQLACLSNTNALHWSMMSADQGPCALPLHQLHHRFASHLVGCMKPVAGIYEHVEKTTGIDPTRILFFDDRPENCQTARDRGWSAHEIALDGDPVSQMRTHLGGYGLL